MADQQPDNPLVVLQALQAQMQQMQDEITNQNNLINQQ
jgi:hypothetical protein